MGYDRVHCSTVCREDTEKKVMNGGVPGWVEFADFWKKKDEDEKRAIERAEAEKKRQQSRASQTSYSWPKSGGSHDGFQHFANTGVPGTDVS
jgi:hypothetical protein